MIYIDVRTKDEYNNGHVDGALHFDNMDMMYGTFPDIPKETECTLYCESGNRSMMAKTILEQNGWKKVIDGGSIDNLLKV